MRRCLKRRPAERAVGDDVNDIGPAFEPALDQRAPVTATPLTSGV
jgi:hypothetical protein